MKIKFEKIKNAFITIEIRTKKPEEFLNLIYNRGIKLNKVQRLDINLLQIGVELKDYKKVKEISEKTRAKIKITGRKGIGFILIKLRNRISILIGGIIFIFLTYYLSTFIWGIDIKTQKNIPPYNIRAELNTLGIKPGISKKSINVYDLEKKLIEKNNDIMWVRVRIYGSHLKINVAERQEPPQIVKNDNAGDVVAKQDGYILRIYTRSGTAVVKAGDVVKKGQVLIKGQQGNEGNVYNVHADGDVIAETFNERIVDVSLTKHVRKRTGKKIENYYLDIGNKKFYLKKSENKFKKYDKIVSGNFFIKKEVYYEVLDTIEKLNKQKLIDNTTSDMYKKLCSEFDKSVKIKNKVVDTNIKGDICTIRILVTTEENISQKQ
ncbi:sporulation protein YqfD [Clostridium hydrogenum]|uniref:sporulation protein YqfD n=1 Tax=Clostridium hydrogenum TaxID=2855764 RepID=UPI001F475BCD|nr:sporulation protein YqfD [Clostridium hydrogenum]